MWVLRLLQYHCSIPDYDLDPKPRHARTSNLVDELLNFFEMNTQLQLCMASLTRRNERPLGGCVNRGNASCQPGLNCHEPAWVSLNPADYHRTADSRYESEQTRSQEELHTGQIARSQSQIWRLVF